MNSSEPTVEELQLIAAAFQSEDEWSSRPRAVYSGEVMERELDELFPVEIGLKVLRERREAREEVLPIQT
ncbi:MAG TPA: hypothetical protein VN843_32415 [Anaerolineales bacterium]|nr:hypothetical protein [Anaerolineales bacterium]